MATDQRTDEDLRSILLTVDGKGRAAKEEALDELLARARRWMEPNGRPMTDEEKAATDAFLMAQYLDCTCAKSGYEGFPCPVHSR